MTDAVAGGQRSLNQYGGWKVAFWFLLPSFIGFLIFYLIPTIRGIYISFTDWNLLANDGEFIGGENYSKLISDDQFWDSMRITPVRVPQHRLSDHPRHPHRRDDGPGHEVGIHPRVVLLPG